MESRLVALLGSGVKHILHGLRRALLAVALTWLIVLVVVAVITEVVGSVLTHTSPISPGSGPLHLAAAALGIAFGYGAAVTVFVAELLRAFIKAIELIVQEAERLEKKAAEEIGILGRKAEEEALKLGRTAVTDAGALGRAVVTDAGAVGRVVGGAVTGVVGGAEHAVGGVVGGAERAVGGVEHGIAAHLPGHHNTAQ
ncbi:MAG: hypothetical protein ACXVA4_04790 [Ktedonobacterales bacterium]